MIPSKKLKDNGTLTTIPWCPTTPRTLRGSLTQFKSFTPPRLPFTLPLFPLLSSTPHLPNYPLPSTNQYFSNLPDLFSTPPSPAVEIFHCFGEFSSKHSCLKWMTSRRPSQLFHLSATRNRFADISITFRQLYKTFLAESHYTASHTNTPDPVNEPRRRSAFHRRT